jgi:hypothetical protein
MGFQEVGLGQERERKVINAFVHLSNELVDEYDIIDTLTTLTTSCADLLDVASAGLLLADESGVLHLVASSSERTRDLELFQLQREQGPCLDCYHGGKIVVSAGLPDMKQQWPMFSQAAELLGFESVHALPMRLREHALGAIGLFSEGVGHLNAADLALAQALVHVACVAIVNDKNASDRATINTQLQHALNSRVVLEQAKGVIAASGNLEMDVAFAVLRRYARDHGRRLSDVAEQVVGRRLRTDVLLRHARSAAILPS